MTEVVVTTRAISRAIVFLSPRYLCSVMLIILHIVYRVLPLSVNPMLRTYINLSSNIVYAYERNCQVGLTSTICRNFEFYQNDTKIRRKLAYEMYICVQLLGGLHPQTPSPRALPLDRAGGTAPRPPL